MEQSVSFTTRKPRRGERPNKDYSFIDEQTFRRMVKSGDFLEWAEVHGNLYGTSKKRLTTLLRSGMDVVLDIDTQGAEKIRKSGMEAIYIFILPPSMRTLKERLSKRNYVIVNNRIAEALGHLEAIITAVRLRSETVSKEFISYILSH
jgi:guanylate kinase